MILCLDSGNTRLKWGLGELSADQPKWQAQGAVAQSELQLLPARLQHLPKPHMIVGCNVAGAAVAARIESMLGMSVQWLTASAEAAGVKSSYVRPQQLGVDRWAALVATRHLCRGNALVVSAGTATTIDMLSADGVFLGGIILPGLTLMLESLARNTAQLPLASAAYQAYPQDTESAIASGVLDAQLGAIERLFARLPDAHCYLTGGAAHAIAPLLSVPHSQVDDLVLQGIMHLGHLAKTL